MSIVFIRGIFPICLFCRRCRPYCRCYIFLGRCRLRQPPIIQYLISCYCKIGKTNDNADADTKITKFGISFNSDGTTTFFAQLEKSSASQKEYLEKLQEKKAAEKKEAKKKEQSKQTEVRKTTVQANSKEELLDKIKNIDWDSIKPEENKIGGRFDFSI